MNSPLFTKGTPAHETDRPPVRICCYCWNRIIAFTMPKKHTFFCTLQSLLLCSSLYLWGADRTDSLKMKDYSYLFSKIRAYKEQPELQGIYLKAFLRNAHSDRDWEMIVNGYKNYMDYAPGKLAIVYSDSMADAAMHSGRDKLIGSAYLSKGIAHYALKDHEKALENYLIAQPYINKAQDAYLGYKLTYNIAHVKYYLGKNEEAIALFESCLGYFKQHNERAYLNILHSLGLCYTRAGNYGRSEETVQYGRREAERLGNHTMDDYFTHLEGQNHFFSRNYAMAIQKLQSSIAGIKENKDYANVAVANFYIGKSYWILRNYSQSIPYLNKVAGAFENEGYIRPDLRENFELLIRYHKNRGNTQQALYYVDQLLRADTLLLNRHDKLYDNIYKNYDTKDLLRQKTEMEQKLSNERVKKKALKYTAWSLGLLILIVIIAYESHRRNQNRLYRKVLSESRNKTSPIIRKSSRELEIAPETVDKILGLLEKWEQAKGFLATDITLTSLAVYLETNTRYVSDIISNYRSKKFTGYINDLKVDHIIEQLQSDRLKRMYTHEALAKDAGFSTTKRFVHAFKARTGISPSFFSEKIRKEMAKK